MADTEKITINLGVVDLGRVDLLVEQGFYTNRTDFIRSAIRNQIATHETELQETVKRKLLAVGVVNYSADELQEKKEKGELFDILVVGMLAIDKDVTPELALATINSIKVYGVFEASNQVKKALANRIK